MSSGVEHAPAAAVCPDEVVVVVRSARGWSVLSPGRVDDVGGLVEGISLADLVAEELGALVEPDRDARRAARGPAGAADPDADPRDARLAALERTVAQLEHALAARVSTERAIGVLAERHGTTPRSAFELLRDQARSQGRAVQELARQVLDGLACRAEATGADVPAPLSTPLRDPGAGRSPRLCARAGRGAGEDRP
ncbi:transcription antitermination regulator [Geodermatophilus sp. TF02-6]|uniref:ANTAR domain-containing protein n=1 Tax=Geodermatophilus sp. TF02-6 TaxID=2250575 RepID=UPI000DEBCF6C|nr:ANTAR domain-containing protein [Geodermatophilus sp. TF02-6]RBY74333.1 transcription antitermination regulator [Geodermatophilus sp. TF02-6]